LQLPLLLLLLLLRLLLLLLLQLGLLLARLLLLVFPASSPGPMLGPGYLYDCESVSLYF
jgi:hypothetical protein